jgi:SIR2-like domain
VELADIMSARSSHFIFKPHGDLNDVSSIVLTREQYRTLTPIGERRSVLDTLKTLLVTRPVLYVGFGLRDPDFIYLRDLLLNIYQGAVRDHWAIMPDVGDEEVDYWRNQYGIKLHGYVTHERADGSRDHQGLLSLIEALATPHAAAAAPTSAAEPSAAERVLALTRYTSGLVRRFTPKSAPIEVRISEVRATLSTFRPLVPFGPYENWTTTRFLAEGPQHAFLIGLPGSGKSFALQIAALQLATQLQQACIE